MGITSYFSLRRPNAALVDRYLADMDPLPFNHDFVGSTAGDSPLPHGRLICFEVSLGQGRGTFFSAREQLLSWDMHRGSSRTSILRASPARHKMPQVGEALATLASLPFGGPPMLWTMNPIRVSYVERRNPLICRSPARFLGSGDGCHAAVGYATLQGHLLAGEERMEVRWHADGQVTFRVTSIARGAGLLGRAVFIFLKSSQNGFFHEQCRCMKLPHEKS